MKKVGVISLGCDKNRVDTERLLWHLREAGYDITGDAQQAEIIIVNTCAFINDARREAVDTILEMARYKTHGSCQKLIVSGCLPVRHSTEILDGMPEVDAVIGTAGYSGIDALLRRLYSQDGRVTSLEETDDFNTCGRVLSTAPHTAFLKIAEGCSNCCTYCTIPKIRGKYRSRAIDSLVSEAQTLAEGGVREITLVAQDVTRYGADLGMDGGLITLLKRLQELDAIKRIKMLYLYPERVTDELIELIAASAKMVKYMDIPFQHIDDGILRRMGRRINGEYVHKLLCRIRAIYPEMSLRSTFIAGFPGETRAAYVKLRDFVTQQRFADAGFFAYSAEEGTPAAVFSGQVSERTKRARVKELYEIQRRITTQRSVRTGAIGGKHEPAK